MLTLSSRDFFIVFLFTRIIYIRDTDSILLTDIHYLDSFGLDFFGF